MTKTNELKKNLRYGDIQSIAKRTGKSESYVQKVLKGLRSSKEIIEAAEELIKSRSELEAKPVTVSEAPLSNPIRSTDEILKSVAAQSTEKDN